MLKQLHSVCEAWYRRLTVQSPQMGAIGAIVLMSSAVTLLVGGVKQLGWLEPLELRAFDRMMQVRPDIPPDPRLLLVEITEEDIRSLRRSTPSDQTLAQAIQILAAQQPQVIGLDLWRDLPQEPGNAELQQQLQRSNVIAITKLGNQDSDGVPPPSGMPADRVGFNDVLVDPDGVVRRNLLFGGSYFSLSLRLALHYLATKGTTPTASLQNPENMQIGQVVFEPLSADAGGYQKNDAAGYQILLNYRSRHSIARRLSLIQVLKRQFEPSWIKNQIILIGTTAPSGKDLFYTPYSAGSEADHQMPGVEIHAQMVSQILSAVLDQRPLFWFAPAWGEWLWIEFWAIVGGGLAFRIRHPLRLGLRMGGTILTLVCANFLIFLQAGWLPIVAPMIAALLTTGAVVVYQAQQAQRQQQMVMTLLGQNASKEIADALWRNRDRLLQSGKLPGQRLTATMLFTDIQGFSSISEQMSPEALLDWLNEYLEAMTQEIQRHEGIVNKFTGDGLLAVFGVPVPRLEARGVKQDANHAVHCALAMGDRLTQLNQVWEQRGLNSIQMRVGIFTGPIVVGSLGGKDRLEYGVIGDSVNIASRLESCAKERQLDTCRILIAEETKVHLEGLQLEAWGPMALKGKQQTVNVYRVVRRSSDPEAPATSDMSSISVDPAISSETADKLLNL